MTELGDDHPLRNVIMPIRVAFETLAADGNPTTSTQQAVVQLCSQLSLHGLQTHTDRVRALHTAFLNQVQIPSANQNVCKNQEVKDAFMRKAYVFFSALTHMIGSMK